MFEHFVAQQRIRACIVDKAMPATDAHAKLRDIFVQVFQSDSRGTLLNDIWSLDDGPGAVKPHSAAKKQLLVGDAYDLLYQRLHGLRSHKAILRQPVYVQSSLAYRGVTFSNYKVSSGDSNIIYGDYLSNKWSAGRIISIFFWPRKDTHGKADFIPCCIVEPYSPLTDSDAASDPYRQYRSDVAGKLFLSEFDPPVVLLMDDVVCHAACTAYRSSGTSIPITHVLPLDRVSDVHISVVRCMLIRLSRTNGFSTLR